MSIEWQVKKRVGTCATSDLVELFEGKQIQSHSICNICEAVSEIEDARMSTYGYQIHLRSVIHANSLLAHDKGGCYEFQQFRG